MESEESYGLNELIENLRKAKEDPKISGILLEVPAGVSGLAIAEELLKRTRILQILRKIPHFIRQQLFSRRLLPGKRSRYYLHAPRRKPRI